MSKLLIYATGFAIGAAAIGIVVAYALKKGERSPRGYRNLHASIDYSTLGEGWGPRKIPGV